MDIVSIIVIGLVISLVGAVIYYFIFKSAILQLDSIKTLIENNKLDDAMDRLIKLYNKDKNNGRIHYLMGQIFEKQEKLQQAISEYISALKKAGTISESEQIHIHSLLAELYFKVKRFDEALGEYLVLSKRYPNDPYYLMQIGEIFFAKKKFSNATNYFKKSLELEAKNPKAHYNIGRIYYFAKNYKDAERHLLQTIKFSPKFYDAYYYLGIIYLQQNHPKMAIQYLKKAVYSIKFKGQAYFQIGVILEASRNCEQAIGFYTKALNNLKDKDLILQAKYNIASCYEKLGKIDEAVKFWEEIALENKSYKDVDKKLALYAELSLDDKFKEYIIDKGEDLKGLINKIINHLEYKILEYYDFKNIIYVIAIPKSIAESSTSRRDNNLFIFYRNIDMTLFVDDLVILKDKMKKYNCSRLHIILPNKYTSDVIEYAQTRNINLIDKDTLLKILNSIHF